MKTVKGIFIILLFMALGEFCSMLMKNFVPGNVLGMMLLFCALSAKVVKLSDVKPVADFLTNNMVWFFVPCSIGLMDQFDQIKAILPGFIVICLVTTLLVVAAVGVVQELQIRRKKS